MQHSVCRTKRIAVELKESVKTELDRLVSIGVVAKIEESTDWVSQAVVVTKGNGSLRICIDPKALNGFKSRSDHWLDLSSGNTGVKSTTFVNSDWIQVDSVALWAVS